MSSEWRAVALGDVVNLRRGFDLPQSCRATGSAPVVSSSGISDFHAASKVTGPGVVTGRYGTIGSVFYVDRDFWPLNTTLYVEDFKGNYPRYIYYLLQTIDYQTYSDKAAVPGINRNHVHQARVFIPPKTEQKRIASVLEAFDDRIEHCQKTNESLEAIARAIFKSWFVDFDPVKAKAEGCEPEGMDAATAALFPSGFQESNLGAIPKGWKIGRLDDLLVLQRGFDLPHSQRTEGPFPVIAASGPNGTHAEYMAKGPGVVTGRSGVLGKVYYVHEDYWPLNTTLWVKEFRAATPLYAVRALERLAFETYNAGSAVPTLNRNHVHGLKVVVPPPGLVAKYDEIATAFQCRSKVVHDQRETLGAVRDTLLPRLISGKLRVPDAEEMLAEVI